MLIAGLSSAITYLLALLFLIDHVVSDQVPLIAAPKPGRRPNIVFILTDDQDVQLDSLSYMPNVKKHLAERGTYYQHHYCTIAICCPSRVSLWTGKAAHNINVTDVHPPYGGYPKFVSQGLNSAYLPIWLQQAGYQTYYTGKLFNAHTIYNWNSPRPAGWTGSEFLLDPHTYEYDFPEFQRNNEPPRAYHNQYSTDAVANISFEFLDDGLQSQDPFFMVMAPIAPHSNMGRRKLPNGKIERGTFPPVPAERHKHLFENVTIPRTPNFNPDKPHGVAWISSLPQQDPANIAYNDAWYRARLQSLQAVDEMVDSLIHRLEAANILENTYIIYTSDNGFHIGQHRLQPGKECAFEEDVNVPLIIRGPGVPNNHTTEIVTTHTDLVPTIMSIIGADLRDDFDGSPIPLTTTTLKSAETESPEHVNIEYWGYALNEGKFGQTRHYNNTYKALRLMGEGYSFLYTVWCSGEHELYDMIVDPYQTTNLYPYTSALDDSHDPSSPSELNPAPPPSRTSNPLLRNPLTPLTNPLSTNPSSLIDSPSPLSNLPLLLPRLDTLLMVLKTCKATVCTHPWAYLHPTGNVHNLHDAMNSIYDDFYIEKQDRVRFDRCEMGYILESEGPRRARVYTEAAEEVLLEEGSEQGGDVFEGQDMWPGFV